MDVGFGDFDFITLSLFLLLSERAAHMANHAAASSTYALQPPPAREKSVCLRSNQLKPAGTANCFTNANARTDG
jgi:hypothetical protein